MRLKSLVWCWLALGVLAGAGCAKRERQECQCFDEASARPVDPVLLAFLSRARATHRLVDAAERDGDIDRAVQLLQSLSEQAIPRGAPELSEVQADTLARLAELESRREHFDRANALVDRGLSIVLEPTYFRGRLYEVRGLIEERRATVMKARGDLVQAESARSRALEALEMATRIQSEVIDRSTRGLAKPATSNLPADPGP